MKSRTRTMPAGFTLVELMIAVVLAAIVLTMGVPAFQTFVQNTRATTQANEIVTAVNYTRSEAVKRGARVSICPSADQASCGNDWTAGWIVFIDSSLNTSGPSVDEVLRVWDGTDGMSLSGPDHVQFRGLGDVVDTPGDFVLTVPGCTGENARRIAINAAGRPRVTREAC